METTEKPPTGRERRRKGPVNAVRRFLYGMLLLAAAPGAAAADALASIGKFRGHTAPPAPARAALATLQGLLPQHALTAVVHRLMRVETPWVKNSLITVISSAAGVDWSEAESMDLDDYRSFNAFFTRELRAGVHVIDPDPALRQAAHPTGRLNELRPRHPA